MMEPISADGLYHQHEECSPEELGSDRDVKSSYQVRTIGNPANDERCQGHREKIYKQIVKAHHGGAAVRRDEIMYRRGQRPMVPGKEECAQAKIRKELHFTGRMQSKVDRRCTENKADWDDDRAPPSPDLRQQV